MDGFKLEASPKKKLFGIASCEAAHKAAQEDMPNGAVLKHRCLSNYVVNVLTTALTGNKLPAHA